MSILPWRRNGTKIASEDGGVVEVVKERRVLGFMFDFRDRYVLLMSHRPEGSLVDYLSGIGGRVPEGEDPGEWMVMAAREATGLHVVDWMPAMILECPSSVTYVYMAQASSTDLKQSKPTVAIRDTCKAIAIDNLNHYRTAPLLPWVIPMLHDPLMIYPFQMLYGEPEGGE
jgi:hypothetical protein